MGPIQECLIRQNVAETQPQLSRGRFWRDVMLGGSFVLALYFFVVQISVVRGLSMSPSLEEGDRLMVDRLSYSVTDVDRFDVVVLRDPRNPGVDFVKRVVGLPGDLVEMCAGQLSVNGEPVSERFGHVVDRVARGAWVVPDDSYFVLGDNRPISCETPSFLPALGWSAACLWTSCVSSTSLRRIIMFSFTHLFVC